MLSGMGMSIRIESVKESYFDGKITLVLKSEVAIASLFYQTKQPKTFSLQVKTITKSPGMGLLSLSNLAIYIKKAEFSGFEA